MIILVVLIVNFVARPPLTLQVSAENGYAMVPEAYYRRQGICSEDLGLPRTVCCSGFRVLGVIDLGF